MGERAKVKSCCVEQLVCTKVVLRGGAATRRAGRQVGLRSQQKWP